MSGNGDNSEDVIRFTPSAGFDIRKAAHHFAALMEDLGQPLIIQLADIDAEFEPGCTPAQIIEGYEQVLAEMQEGLEPSNSNSPVDKK